MRVCGNVVLVLLAAAAAAAAIPRKRGSDVQAASGGSGNDGAVFPFVDLSASTNVCRTLLPILDDGHSRAVNIPMRFPFGNSTQDVAYVSTNGYITFGRAVSHFDYELLTNYSYTVAPFWSDIDVQCRGEVLYYATSEIGPTLLDGIGEFINATFNEEFKPLWVLIAQWNEVPPYVGGSYCREQDEGRSDEARTLDCACETKCIHEWFGIICTNSHIETIQSIDYFIEHIYKWVSESNLAEIIREYFHPGTPVNDLECTHTDLWSHCAKKRNTFQAALMTNGVESYAVFTYSCDYMKWSEPASIGFFGQGNFSRIHTYSGDDSVGCSPVFSEWASLAYPLHQPKQPPRVFDLVPASHTCIAGCCDVNLGCVSPSCECKLPITSDCTMIIEEECSSEPYHHPFLGMDTANTMTFDGAKSDPIPVQLEMGFPFGDRRRHEAYVARDGYISFAETDSQLQPNDFPSLPYSVAPYWTPTRSIDPSGGVYYEVHVEDDDLLYEVSTLINRRMNNTQFNGKWMLVAYWKRVSPLLSALNPQFLNRTNSFQAIVITDGVFSYALFIYECCSMEWSGLYDYRVTIGFNSDGIHYDNHPLSRADDAAAVACLGLPDSGWTNIIYELTYGMPQPTKPHEEGGIFLHLCMDVTKVFRLICQQGMNNSDITVAVVSTMEPHDEGGMDDSDITVAVASIVIAVPLFIAVTAVAVACYIVYRRKYKQTTSEQRAVELELQLQSSTQHHGTDVVFPKTLCSTSLMSLADGMGWREKFAGILVRSSQVELLESIGEGAFGKVYEGHMTASEKSSTLTDVHVAVKTLKRVSSVDEITDFIAESVIMLDFDHPNVMSLVGVSLDTEDHRPLIILPYMAHGDLKSFLTCKRKSSMRSTSDVQHVHFPEDISCDLLAAMCLDVAKGMEYLASRNFVHRDVAARNCMVDDMFLVKIADFGLSRDLYRSDYYRLTHKAMLPVKWMSPESLFDNIYNQKTDVWSFGVTCWEIFSLGRTPYPGVSNVELPDYISMGNRLRKPLLCPQQMYNIISSCWKELPEERPHFSAIAEKITDAKQSGMELEVRHDYAILEMTQEEAHTPFNTESESAELMHRYQMMGQEQRHQLWLGVDHSKNVVEFPHSI